MATAYIPSKQDKAKAQQITQMVEDGTKATPPALKGKVNTCSKCGKETMLARFYIPRVGYSCESCFDDWRTTPVWCDTRASDVHVGRVHVIPQCVIDAEAKSAPQTPQDAPKTRVFVWDAKQQEEAWTKARKASEAKRGNVLVMPWKEAA